MTSTNMVGTNEKSTSGGRVLGLHLALIAALGALIVAALALPVLVVAGTSLSEAVRAAGIIGIQIIPGTVLVVLLIRPATVDARELWGLGGVLGALIFLAIDQWTLGWELHAASWWLPAAVAIVLSALHRDRVKIDLGGGRQALVFVGLLALGAYLLASLWLHNPLSFDNWVAFFPDLSYHEALAQGLALVGPSQTSFLAGVPFDYHWFGDAWAGALSNSADLSPYVALSRGLYVYALITGIALAWAWGSRLSTRAVAGPFAALLLVAGTFIGLGTTYSYTMFLTDISPTHTFAIPLAIAVSLLVTLYVSGGMQWPVLALLAALGAGTMGARAPQAMILLAAAGLILLVSIATHAWTQARRALEAIASLVIGMAPIYAFVIASDASNATTRLLVQPNNEIVILFGFLPYTGPGDNVFAFVALVGSALACWAGLLVVLMRSKWRVAAVWGAGAAIAGIAGTVLLAQNGRSQVSFLWAGAAVALPLSGVGIAEGIAILRRKRRPIVLPIAIGAMLGVATVAVVELTPGLWFAGYLRWGMVVGSWVLGVLVGIAWAPSPRRPLRFGTAAVATLALVLSANAVAADIVGSTARTFTAQPTTTAETPIAINRDHFAAAEWVRDNVGPHDGYLATNRQCDVVTIAPTGCVSTSFITSALTGRPTLIEGFSYGIQSMPEWAVERSLSSYAFPIEPSPELVTYLRDQGVRWVWIDTMVQSDGNWEQFGSVAFDSPTVTILDIGRVQGSP